MEIHFIKHQKQCNCFRHVINLTWPSLDKYVEYGLELKSGQKITQDIIDQLFEIQHILFRINANLEPKRLLYSCADVIAVNDDLNLELLPKRIRSVCEFDNVFARRLWYWSKE